MSMMMIMIMMMNVDIYVLMVCYCLFYRIAPIIMTRCHNYAKCLIVAVVYMYIYPSTHLIHSSTHLIHSSTHLIHPSTYPSILTILLSTIHPLSVILIYDLPTIYCAIQVWSSNDEDSKYTESWVYEGHDEEVNGLSIHPSGECNVDE